MCENLKKEMAPDNLRIGSHVIDIQRIKKG